MIEAHLWGKGEIEDMLFQPKNDHLLFAYFGISLQVRRRSLRTDVRSRVATKRKAQKFLLHRDVLVRDAGDERYPYLDDDQHMRRLDRGRWFVSNVSDCHHDGVHLVGGRHLAFLADDGVSWDYAEKMNDVNHLHDPWREEVLIEQRYQAREEARAIWDALGEKNRGIFVVYLVLPYENILVIDENGDEMFGEPHIYTSTFTTAAPPWRYVIYDLMAAGQKWRVDEPARVKVFPRKGERVKNSAPSIDRRLQIDPDANS